ncbi:unnamed protein product [Closterium sp. NIES-54]
MNGLPGALPSTTFQQHAEPWNSNGAFLVAGADSGGEVPASGPHVPPTQPPHAIVAYSSSYIMEAGPDGGNPAAAPAAAPRVARWDPTRLDQTTTPAHFTQPLHAVKIVGRSHS